MRNLIIGMCMALTLAASPTKAQFVVTDPINLVQSILNSAQEIIQTSSTVTNVIKNFQEVKKVYDQGKEYYDALKSVNNLVKDARKVQQTVLMVGDISEMYVVNFSKMTNDPNFTPEELTVIAHGYTQLLNESAGLLTDLQKIVNDSSLSMTDKERMDMIERVHGEVEEYYNLVRYYTNKNISVSYLRAKKQKDAARVLQLYGRDNQKYW